MTNFKQILGVLFLVWGVGIAAGAFLYQVKSVAAQEKVDAQAEARAVIERAVKAHGGEMNLSKFKAVSAKWEGKRKVEMLYWDSINVVTYQMPDKVRIDSEVHNPNGTKFSVYKVVNGKKGWQGSSSRIRDLKDAEAALILDDMYALWLASLVPLNDKSFEFAPAGQITVDDEDAIGVRVSRKERPDVNLYFNKKTGLLVKSERRAKDLTGQEFNAESFYREHKAFQGVMWATKRHDKRDGMDLEGGAGRFELSEFRALDALDEKLFTKP